jgi:predicted DNA-binding transcriptional regulator AlpA
MSDHSIAADTPADELVSPARARRECGDLSPSTVWRLEQRGEFPKKIKITPARTGYIRSELEQWKAKRIAAALAARQPEAR